LPELSASWAGFSSWRYYDLRGDRVRIEVPTVPDTDSEATVFLHLVRDGQNYLILSEQQGQLYQSAFVDDAWLNVGSRGYEPSAHRYWQIREEAGTVHWEASADGDSYAELASWPVANLFPVDNVQIEFGASTEGTELNPGEAQFDDLNGGPPATGAWCPTEALSDDFADGVRSADWGRTYDGAGCTADELGAELAIEQIGPGPCDCAYISSRAYDLTGGAAVVEVPSIDDGDGHIYAFFRLEQDGAHAIEFVLTAGALVARVETGSGFQTVRSQPYDPTPHRWWRLREQAGTTFWEVSADGQVWSDYGQLANPCPPGALDVVLGGGIDTAGNWSGVVRFDNYNLPP
jgi:hypothetical protein